MTATTVTALGEDLVVTLQGRLSFRDHAETDALIGYVAATLSASPAVRRVVFDIARVDMIDSHWLGLFVRARKHAQEVGGRDVVLRSPRPAVGQLLELVRFGHVFRIEP